MIGGLRSQLSELMLNRSILSLYVGGERRPSRLARFPVGLRTLRANSVKQDAVRRLVQDVWPLYRLSSRKHSR